MRIWILLVGLVGLIVLSLGAVPVHFDEAQYTTWLAHPDLSYQTKGPLVTAVQSLTHGIEWLPQLVQVRLPAWIAWLLSGVLLVWLGRLAGFDQEAGRRLLILFVTSPMILRWAWCIPRIFGYSFSCCWPCVRLPRFCIVDRISKLSFGGCYWVPRLAWGRLRSYRSHWCLCRSCLGS